MAKRRMKGTATASAHSHHGPIEVDIGSVSRRAHQGWIRDDGKPHVDDQTGWIEIKRGQMSMTIFGDAADLRTIAARATEAAETLERTPAPCPGKCGYGCAPPSGWHNVEISNTGINTIDGKDVLED